MTDEDFQPRYSKASKGLTIGIQLAVGMAIFTFIGYKIEPKYGTLGGMFVGLFYGGYEIWKLIKETKEE